MAQEIQQINVLEVNTSFGYAGAQRTMISFCKYFSQYFKPFAVSYGEGGPRENDLKELGIDYIVAHKDIAKIVAYAKDKKVSVIHMHRSGQFDQFEHDLLKQLHEALPASVIIETNVFAQFDKPSSDNIDCHLMKSKMMLNERFAKEAGFFDFNQMKVVYNPVDYSLFEKFTLTAEQIKTYRESLGIAQTDFVIGRLGRADIAKWSDLVLDMLPYAVKELPNLKFILQAAPESRITKINKSLLKKHCIFLAETGKESEVHRFYQAIDVLAHSSKIGESFGNTLNEAMYWKKAVVTNSTPHRDNGQVEQIDHMQTGIIANHPETFARAVVFLAKNKAEALRMGENGRHKVTTEYNPTATTRRLEKVFVEKMVQKHVPVSQEIVDFYAKIEYYPSEKDIVAYREDYQKRIKDDFGTLSKTERLRHFFRKPLRFYRKVRDYAEHRYGL